MARKEKEGCKKFKRRVAKQQEFERELNKLHCEVEVQVDIPTAKKSKNLGEMPISVHSREKPLTKDQTLTLFGDSTIQHSHDNIKVPSNEKSALREVILSNRVSNKDIYDGEDYGMVKGKLLKHKSPLLPNSVNYVARHHPYMPYIESKKTISGEEAKAQYE